MSQLEDAIRIIEQQVAVDRACCMIVDEGFADESSLMGTRDGYLNLALSLLRFVAEADVGGCRNEEDDCAWDDRVTQVMYDLPNWGTWIVGAYLFRNHLEFMTKLRQWVDPQIGYPLTNDPQFQDPESPEHQ